jgi:hypothetical protein
MGIAAERFVIAAHPARQRHLNERAADVAGMFDARAQAGA